ncbi:VOC family protein [uncultured Roseobacter sp.]
MGNVRFFFRESTRSQTSTFWVFCDDVDEAYTDLIERGADIREQPEDKPWGLRQFTVHDLFENQFYFFHDL